MGRNIPAGFSKIFIWSLSINILRIFLKKVQFFQQFWTLSSKIYWTFAENLPQVCQKCIIGVKGNILRKKQPFWKKYMFFLVVFELPANFFLGKSTKIIQHGCHPSYFVYTGEESEQKVFFGKKTFSFDVRNFSNKKTGGGGVQGNTLRLFLEKHLVFTTIYGIWSKTFRKFFERFRFCPRIFDGVV